MSTCRNRRDTLWLDLYGELNPAERAEWARHLERCGPCREEKERAAKMVDLIQEGSPTPIPPPDGAERFIQGVEFKNVLAGKRRPGSRIGSRMPWAGALLSPRPSPSLIAVAACLLLFIGGVIGLHRFTSSGAPSLLGNPPETTAILNDEEAEVIRNLDLLQEMDAIQKLVQRVDRADPDLFPGDSTTERQRSDADHGALV